MSRNTRVVDVTSNGVTVQVPLVVDRATNGDETVGRAIVLNDALVSTTNPFPIHRTSRLLAAANYATATNAAAVVTFAAVAGQSNIISGIAFSYSATPAAGSLTITDGGITVFSIDILSGGAGFIPFDAPVKAAANSALVVTLSAGGTAVVGKLSIFSHWREA